MYRIEKYNSLYYSQWNAFVEASKNGTFLFHRDFMEYHADRFEDYSLMVFDGEKLLALLPANRVGNEVHSHDGLTYGGLVLPSTIQPEMVNTIYAAILNNLNSANLKILKIKQIPDLYFKGIQNKQQVKKVATERGYAIDFSCSLSISSSKLKHFRKVSKSGVELKLDNNFNLFWDHVLKPRLTEKYNTAPVHTNEEIKYLHSKFPENILQYNVYYEGAIVAGITIFDFGEVVKSQYGATTAAGEKLRALDYAYITLIEKYKATKRYFDLGTVKPDNVGLAKQKQELGGNVYTQDIYEVETSNYKRLNGVLI